MKRRHKKSVIAILVIVMAIYIGNLLIDNPYTHSLVNYYINNKILIELPIGVEYQSMKLQLIPPAINIYGIKVKTKTTNEDPTDLVTLSSLSFKISPWSIFMGSQQLGDLELKDLKGSWPLPDDFTSAMKSFRTDTESDKHPFTWPPDFPPPLSSLKISNASIITQLDGISINSNQDPKESTRIITDGLSIHADFIDWQSFKIDLNSTNISITDRGSSYIENGRINLRAEMRGNTFVGKKIELSSPRLDFFGKSNTEIKMNKKGRFIESINSSITGETVEGDMSILGSFLDIPGNRGEFKASTKTNLFIPVTSKRPLTFSTTGSIASKDARFFGFRLYETESDFEVDMEKFKLSNTSLKIGNLIVAKGGGQINFDKSTSYDFILKPENLPFRNLMDIFNVDIDTFNFSLSSPQLKINGTSNPFKMNVSSDATLSNFTIPSANYDKSKFPTPPTCQLNLNMEVNSASLFFQDTNGHCFTPGSSSDIGRFPLSVSGFATFDEKTGMDLNFHSPQFNLFPISHFAQTKLTGKGTLDSRIFGPYSRVKILTGIDIKDAGIGGNQFAAIKLVSEVYDGKLSWKDALILTHQGGSVESMGGTLNLNDALEIDFHVSAKRIDTLTMSTLIKDLTAGETQIDLRINALTAQFRGPARSPLSWQGSLSFDLENIRLNSGTLAKSMKGTLKGTNSGYYSEDIAIESAGTKTLLRFNHVWDKQAKNSNFLGDIGLHQTDQLDISATMTGQAGKGDDIRLLPIIGPELAALGISTELSGDIKLAGNFEGLTGLARLQLSGTKILDASVSDILGSIVIDRSKLDIMAEQGGSALKARISLDLGSPEIPFNWYIAARNADFRPWLPAIMSQDARNFAYLSATWNLKGNFKNWWDSVGELDLRDIRIRYYSMVSRSGQRIDFRNAHSSKIFFAKSGWTLADNRPVVISSSLGELSLGLKNHKPPSQLGLLTRGHIDMEAIRLLLSDVEVATGSIKLDGGIFGSADKPNVAINLRDATEPGSDSTTAVGLAAFRPSFQNIKLDAHVGTNGLTLKTLRANKGNGDIQVNGFLARPESGEETEITINMDNTSFLYPFPIIKYFESTVDGQIKVTGSGRPWSASGSVNIVKARSNRDVDLREAILESIRSQAAVDSTNSITPLINMDISISADKTINFSSRAGQATLSSDLRISGSNITPSIIGLVDISKGRFFYKRDFEIKRGLLNFDDPIKVDPALDISATSDVSSYRVGINISGRASSPIIDFTVDPPTKPDGTPLSKIDIIGLLNRGSLPDSSSAIGTAESTAASEALNIAAGQVEDTVQKIFDLSGQSVIRQVYIDTYADEEGMPIVRFNLPLNITEDFDVVLKVDQSTVKVSSEYSLHDSISLTGGIESTNDQTGINSKTSGAPADTGVDLKFKFAFP